MSHSFEIWVENHKNINFRYWIHKTIFTPYELAEKFTDQSCTENDEAMYGYITDYSILPNNDILIGFSEDKEANYISYYKLSEIDINYSKSDNED